MGFDGSGGYDRVHNWVSDKNAGIKIIASRMDAEMDDMASAFTLCLTKDGQQNPTANLPMASFKHTGVAVASARTDYLDVAQYVDGAFVWAGKASGTSAIALTLNPTISEYKDGMRLGFIAVGDNASAVTVNADGVSATDLFKGKNTPLAPLDIVSGAAVWMTYVSAVGWQMAGTTEENPTFVSITTTGTSRIPTIDGGVVLNEEGSAVDFRVEGDTAAGLLFVDGSEDRAGISAGAESLITDGLFHIVSGSAGAVTADVNADELVIEASANNMGVTFVGTAVSTQRIRFGDVDTTVANEITFSHSSDAFDFNVLSISRLNLSGNGAVFNETGNATADFRVEGDTATGLFFCDAGNDRAGVSAGASSLITDGLFHISQGTAGSVGVSAGFDTLVLESSASAGITILSPDGFSSSIVFGHPSDAIAANIIYNNTTKEMVISAGSNDLLVIDGDQENIIINAAPRPTITTGTKQLAFPIGTSPTAIGANMITIGAKDSSAGATDATLELWLETAPIVIGTFNASHKFPIWINGTEYHIQLDAV